LFGASPEDVSRAEDSENIFSVLEGLGSDMELEKLLPICICIINFPLPMWITGERWRSGMWRHFCRHRRNLE